MVGWVLFGLLLIWYFMSMSHSHKKQSSLRNYIVCLLLSDDIRQDHKQNLEECIRDSNANNALDLNHRAQDVVENMALHLAESGSSHSSQVMVWKVKEGG